MSDFRITADRKAVARYTGSVTLVEGVSRDLVEPYGARIQVRDGFNVNGTEELVSVGTMRIDEVDEDEAGSLTVTGFSVEKAVEDARLWQPLYVDNDSTIAAIVDLLSVVSTPVSIRTVQDAPVRGIVYERERWEAVDGHDRSLARSLGVEVFADAEGEFVIRDIPTVEDGSVWTVDAGTSGVLVTYRSNVSREGVFNAVRAENDRVDQGQPPIFAIVADMDESSKTYINGPFGGVTRFYASPLLLSMTQAASAAAAILVQSKGLQRSVTFTSFPHPALEPGDVVTIVLPDGRMATHLFDRVEHSSSGYQGGETRTTSGILLDAPTVDP